MESQSPCVGCTTAEIGLVTEKPKLISVCIDTGTEITVWPPELAPETPTEECEESRTSVKYFGPGQGRPDTRQPRTQAVHHPGLRDEASPDGCDVLAIGHDVHFTAEGSRAEHREIGDVMNLVRRGGKFEIDGGGVIPVMAPGMPTAAKRARHQVHHCPEEDGVAYVATDYAFMGEKVEDDRMNDKCLPIFVHKFYKD